MKILAIIYLSVGVIYGLVIGYYSHTSYYNYSKAIHDDEVAEIISYAVFEDRLHICMKGIKATDFFNSYFEIEFPLASLDSSSVR